MSDESRWIARRLNEVIRNTEEAILSGNYLDISVYKYDTGKLAGLKQALLVIEDKDTQQITDEQ